MTGSLSTARTVHTATLLNNGMVLMAGGVDPAVTLASAELYNPATGTFTPTGSLNTARVLAHGDAAEQRHGADCGRPVAILVGSASAELYNPATGTFTVTGSLNTARVYHTATLLNNGMVLMAGGLDSSGDALASAELYNPATGTFTYTGSLNTARTRAHGDAAEQRHGADGGRRDCNPATAVPTGAELYNPATGTFTLYRQPEHRAHAITRRRC